MIVYVRSGQQGKKKTNAWKAVMTQGVADGSPRKEHKSGHSKNSCQHMLISHYLQNTKKALRKHRIR